MGKERSLYIDVLKGICILLVVIGHAIQYGAGIEYLRWATFLYNPLYIFIYSFHMPLFMMISGYLFALSAKKRSPKELLIAKVKQLLIPLFSWSIVTTVIESIKAILGISAHKFGIIWIGQTVLSAFIHGPWFLWALWWSSLIIIVGKWLWRDNPIPYLVLPILLLFVPDFDNTALYKFTLPFFLMAYLYAKYDLARRLKRVYMNPAFILAVIASFIFLLRFYSFDSYIYTTGYTLIGKSARLQPHNDAFRLVIGVLGSISMAYAVLAMVRYSPEALMKPLAYLGASTLGIYLISNYFFDELLKRMPIPGFSYLYVLIEVVTVTAASLLITALLKRFKTTNRLFLGGR